MHCTSPTRAIHGNPAGCLQLRNDDRCADCPHRVETVEIDATETRRELARIELEAANAEYHKARRRLEAAERNFGAMAEKIRM